MKDLTRFYMRLASALEKRFTSPKDKKHAAILLRNAAIETPHCHFCGNPAKEQLHESRYNPKARICKLCAVDIAEGFKAQAAGKSQTVEVEYRRDTSLGPRRSYDHPVSTVGDYRRDTSVVQEGEVIDLGPVRR